MPKATESHTKVSYVVQYAWATDPEPRVWNDWIFSASSEKSGRTDLASARKKSKAEGDNALLRLAKITTTVEVEIIEGDKE